MTLLGLFSSSSALFLLARAIAVERLRDAVSSYHRGQRGQDRVCGLGFGELGVEHATRGVVHDDDQAQPQFGSQRQPAMPTAVDVEHLAEAGPRFAPDEVPPARS